MQNFYRISICRLLNLKNTNEAEVEHLWGKLVDLSRQRTDEKLKLTDHNEKLRRRALRKGLVKKRGRKVKDE